MAYSVTAAGTVSQIWRGTVKLISERELTGWWSKYAACEFQFQKVKLDNRFIIRCIECTAIHISQIYGFHELFNAVRIHVGCPIKVAVWTSVHMTFSVTTEKIPRNLTIASFNLFHSAITFVFKIN